MPTATTAHSLSYKLTASLVVIGLCILLKWHFAEADAIRLDWLLWPTSRIVSFCSGMPFIATEGAGYYNYAENILIAPACSGMNFFIILLATGGCLTFFTTAEPATQVVRLICLSCAAFIITLFVNTMRILIAIELYRQDLSGFPFSQEQLHRIEGVVIYYVCLCLYAMLLSALLGKKRSQEPSSPLDTISSPHAPVTGFTILIPLGCYLLFTVGLPFANGAAVKAFSSFIEHSLTILTLSAGLSYALYKLCKRRMHHAVEKQQ